VPGCEASERTPGQVEPLATEQVHALAEAGPERYRALIVFTAGTGVRQGEAFGLTLPHLDMLRRQVRVEQQLVLLPGRPPYLAPPKTAASHRTIPLPNVVIDALAEHLTRFGASQDELVFTTELGRPIRRTGFSAKVWIRASPEPGSARARTSTNA
jgi:integrase